MKKTLVRIISVVAVLSILLAMTAVSVSASTFDTTDIYLKINGIEGESQESKHDKWIDVLNFTHGSVQSVQTGSPDAAGRGIFEPIVFKHVVDKATPNIQEACMNGSRIKMAELHFCRAIAGKQEVVYKVKFEDLKIVKAEVEVEELPDGNCRLVETVQFLANKMTWTESAVGLDNALGGNTEASFDQSKKASMFDSNTTLTLTMVCVVLFVLLVVAVIFLVSKKKKTAAAGAPVEESQNS